MYEFSVRVVTTPEIHTMKLPEIGERVAYNFDLRRKGAEVRGISHTPGGVNVEIRAEDWIGPCVLSPWGVRRPDGSVNVLGWSLVHDPAHS